jgi:hypothetical protein
MSIERDGVACATSRGAVDAFVRVVSQPDRRILAVADGHTCGWTSGVKEISGAVLDGVDRALLHDPFTPVEEIFEAARAEFLRVAEPYPEDDDVGGPAAQLTVVELTDGRFRAGKLGLVHALVVRDGLAQGESEKERFAFVERKLALPTMVEMPLHAGDLVVVSYKWVNDRFPHDWSDRALRDVIEKLVRAHSKPNEIVDAAVATWKDEVRRKQQLGTLIGEPQLAIAATRA